MKKIICTSISILLAVALASCQKQPEAANTTETKQVQSALIKQFEESDIKIGKFLDQLDSPNTPLKVKKQILCIDYPNVYIKEYSPAFLNLSANDYSKELLDRDLEIALDYYKDKFDISCS